MYIPPKFYLFKFIFRKGLTFVTGCLFIGVLMISSCQNKPNQTANSITDKNTQEVFKIKIQRFEKDIFTIPPDSIAVNIPRLRAKYKEFFDLYTYKVISLGPSEDPKFPKYFKSFLTDYFMNVDYNRVIKVFSNVEDIENQLTNAFLQFKHYFPSKRIPRVYTCLSGWNLSIVTTDTILAISLDKYLGSNCELYSKLELDNYMRYTMRKEFILPDCMRDWGYTTFDFKDSASDVLSNMLYEGKIMYFMKKMLPELHDSLIFGFTPSQLKWCKNNRTQMWTYLVEKKLLYSTDILTIHKLIYPAPFTTLFTNESPGRATIWLGYKIIAAYMEHNDKITLQQLMEDNNYRDILRNSQYKP